MASRFVPLFGDRAKPCDAALLDIDPNGAPVDFNEDGEEDQGDPVLQQQVQGAVGRSSSCYARGPLARAPQPKSPSSELGNRDHAHRAGRANTIPRGATPSDAPRGGQQ